MNNLGNCPENLSIQLSLKKWFPSDLKEAALNMHCSIPSDILWTYLSFKSARNGKVDKPIMPQRGISGSIDVCFTLPSMSLRVED
jgi:hypothetical protein